MIYKIKSLVDDLFSEFYTLYAMVHRLSTFNPQIIKLEFSPT